MKKRGQVNDGLSKNLYQRQAVLWSGCCYICERPGRTHLDEIGGNICDECEARKQAVRMRYALADGYQRKGGDVA